MARKPKSVADIDKEIEALKARRAEVLEAQAVHIGKLAVKAGLTMLEISDADLAREFKAIADRFRNRSTPPASASR